MTILNPHAIELGHLDRGGLAADDQLAAEGTMIYRGDPADLVLGLVDRLEEITSATRRAYG